MVKKSIVEIQMNKDEQSTIPSAKQRSLKNRMLRRAFLLGLISIGGLYVISFSGQAPTNIGVVDGKLAACPDSPNCVSTQATDSEQKMSPIALATTDTNQAAIKKIKSVIDKHFSRAKLISEKENYLHYEFTSLIFRFVDDVEFYVNTDKQQIDFRSAARVGHSDLGKNRKRMQKISGLLSPPS